MVRNKTNGVTFLSRGFHNTGSDWYLPTRVFTDNMLFVNIEGTIDIFSAGKIHILRPWQLALFKSGSAAADTA
ncbi:MAG: hypothetical protein ACLFQK_00405 [Fibrobacterota bacterium]